MLQSENYFVRASQVRAALRDTKNSQHWDGYIVDEVTEADRAEPLLQGGSRCSGFQTAYRGCGVRIPNKALEPNLLIIVNEKYVTAPTHRRVTSAIYMHCACAEKVGLTVGAVLRYNGGEDTWHMYVSQDPSWKALPTLKRIPIEKVRTQKIAGLIALDGNPIIHNQEIPPTIIMQDDSLELDKALALLGGPVKARPAPPRARHGFAESRVVNSVDEARAVWQSAKDADPESEMMLQPAVDAAYSAVCTSTAFTFGPGCDSATAGKNAVTMRLGAGIFSLGGWGFEKDISINSPLLRLARIPAGEDGYLEMVWDAFNPRPIIVQLRGGPKLDGTPNYIPRKLKVASVYKLSHAVDHTEPKDLLEWETTVPQLPKGTVVWHPGGAVSSHFGVHCALNHVPYITTYEPHEGDTLEPKAETPPMSPDVVRDGMLMGIGTHELPATMSTYSQETASAIFALHNSPFNQDDFGAWYLGYSAARLWRMMAMACVGEMRHFKRGHHLLNLPLAEQKGGWPRGNTSIPHDSLCAITPEPWLRMYLYNYMQQDREARESVFHRAWPMGHHELQAMLTASTHAFLKHLWSDGIGGLNWGRCGMSALHLYEAMVHHSTRPTPRSLKYLNVCMNRAVNLVHNGGPLLNKFLHEEAIDGCSKLNRGHMLNFAVPALFQSHALTTHPSAPAMETEPRLWRRALPRKLIEYAKSDRSCKRSVHWSGDESKAAEEKIYLNAAQAIGNCFYCSWTAYIRECYDGVTKTLYKSHTDYNLWEAQTYHSRADEMKAELAKMRAELRKRKKAYGYTDDMLRAEVSTALNLSQMPVIQSGGHASSGFNPQPFYEKSPFDTMASMSGPTWTHQDYKFTKPLMPKSEEVTSFFESLVVAAETPESEAPKSVFYEDVPIIDPDDYAVDEPEDLDTDDDYKIDNDVPF